MRIFKYLLDRDVQEFDICPGDEVVHIGEQDGRVHIWIKHTNFPFTDKVRVHTIGTEWNFHNKGFHKSSVVTKNGLVWHYFVEYISNEKGDLIE